MPHPKSAAIVAAKQGGMSWQSIEARFGVSRATIRAVLREGGVTLSVDAPLYAHQCLRCRHSWHSHTESPKRCAACRSSAWSEAPVSPAQTRIAWSGEPNCRCLQCGNDWRSLVEDPEACPRCRSQEWQTPPPQPIPLHCLRCEHSWTGSARKRPSHCPRCASPKWEEPPRPTFPQHCHQCGHDWKAVTSSPARCAHCQSAQWRSGARGQRLIPRALEHPATAFRPSPGSAPFSNARSPYAGKGCKACGNLVGCSCAPLAESLRPVTDSDAVRLDAFAQDEGLRLRVVGLPFNARDREARREARRLADTRRLLNVIEDVGEAA